MGYPQDIEAGANRNPTHPLSPWYENPIEELAQDIMSGQADISVWDCLVAAVKESESFCERCEEALQDISIGPSCGYSTNKIVNEAVMLAATKIYEGL